MTPTEQSAWLLGKAYFDLREFRRCAATLAACTHPLPFFLANYALYLAGERAKEEESEGDLIGALLWLAAAETKHSGGGTTEAEAMSCHLMSFNIVGKAAGPRTLNPELEALRATLEARYDK